MKGRCMREQVGGASLLPVGRGRDRAGRRPEGCAGSQGHTWLPEQAIVLGRIAICPHSGIAFPSPGIPKSKCCSPVRSLPQHCRTGLFSSYGLRFWTSGTIEPVLRR